MIIDLLKTFFSLIKLNLIFLFNKILYPKIKILQKLVKQRKTLPLRIMILNNKILLTTKN